MAKVLWPADRRIWKDNGDPAASGTIAFRLADTSTATAVYSDKELQVSLGSSVNIGSDGYLENYVTLYGADDVAYDGVITSSGVHGSAAWTIPDISLLNQLLSVSLGAAITPTQIAANTNNYAPTSGLAASVWRLSSDAARDITGIDNGSTGRVLVLPNVGSYTITLKDASSSSSAENRFSFGTDIYIPSGQSVAIYYDADSARWRLLSPAALSAVAQTLTQQTTKSAMRVTGLDVDIKGYLFGLTLSNNASDATNDIDIAPGVCADTTGAVRMALASSITKRLDAAWTVGTGNGGLDQGSIANATYHKHLIMRSDSGVVDAIYSLSHDRSRTVTMTVASPAVVTWGVAGNGHGLVAGSPFKFSTTGALPTGVTAGTQYYVISTGLTETTFQFSTSNGGSAVNSSGTQSGVHTGLAGPQLPTSYDYFRRIGSVLRESAVLVAFSQVEDEFLRLSPAGDVAATNPGTSAVLRPVSVPTGVIFTALVNVLSISASADTGEGRLIITSPSQSDVTAANAQYNAGTYGAAAAASQAASLMRVRTDAAARIRTKNAASSASTQIVISATGWIDTRGRNG